MLSPGEPALWVAGSRFGRVSHIAGHAADGMRERCEDYKNGHREGGDEACEVSILAFVSVQHDWILPGLRTGAKIGLPVSFINGTSRCSMFRIPEQYKHGPTRRDACFHAGGRTRLLRTGRR